MDKATKIQKKINKFLKNIPKRHEYWLYLEDQEKYIEAHNKFFKNKADREILQKYYYIGIPPVYPNYKNISKDYPKIAKLVKKLNALQQTGNGGNMASKANYRNNHSVLTLHGFCAILRVSTRT